MAWVCGWESIAAYIHRHPDTAKRYHKRFGMPIHRDPGGRPIALTQQIDIWLIEFNLLENGAEPTPIGENPIMHSLKHAQSQAKSPYTDKRKKKHRKR